MFGLQCPRRPVVHSRPGISVVRFMAHVVDTAGNHPANSAIFAHQALKYLEGAGRITP